MIDNVSMLVWVFTFLSLSLLLQDHSVKLNNIVNSGLPIKWLITFSEFAFGGLTKNPPSTSKNGIIKIQKFLLVRPPADANLVLVAGVFVSPYVVKVSGVLEVETPVIFFFNVSTANSIFFRFVVFKINC